MPPDAGTHQQPFVVGHIFQDFGKRGFEALRAKLDRALQNLRGFASLQRVACSSSRLTGNARLSLKIQCK
jgi:hypothetical protein